MRVGKAVALAVAQTVALSVAAGVALGRLAAPAGEHRVTRVVVPIDVGTSPAPQSTALPTATLRVFSDGCGVIRSGIPGGEPRGLTWSIADVNGFAVLERNALNETHYRYYQPGTYTVVLTAWDGTKYAAISNRVTIHC